VRYAHETLSDETLGMEDGENCPVITSTVSDFICRIRLADL
jgi:hypothetical protein